MTIGLATGARVGLRAGLVALFLAAALAHGEGATRPYGKRVAVTPDRLRVMDGDTAEIRWSAADVETVRVLGIDTPELFTRDSTGGARRDPRGTEALGFARGAFAMADRVELLRCRNRDRFRRTLGYFFLDGRNYSVMVIEARLARETISRYGDNGLAREADEVRRAVRRTESAAGTPHRPSH